jgi:hypothetical protein
VLSATMGPNQDQRVIHNAGAGPAIGCRCAIRKADGGWGMTDPIDLAAGETGPPLWANGQADRRPVTDFFAPPATAPPPSAEVVMVIFARDVLGRLYRFTNAGGASDHLHWYDAEVWVPGDEPAPPWTLWAMLWPAR